MIAMALGNIYGGRSADKNPDPDRLYKKAFDCGGLDRGDSGGGKIYYSGDIGSIDPDHQHKFSDTGGIFCLYVDLCVSAVSAGNGNAVTGEIYNRFTG